MTHIKTLVLSAAAVVAMATPAPAQDITESRTVRYKDLDIDTDRGARRLYARIDQAVLEICGSGRTSLEPIKRATRRTRCWQDGARGAVEGLNAPAVTAVWRRMTGAPVSSRPTAEPQGPTLGLRSPGPNS